MLQAGPIRHPTLPPALAARILRVQEQLREVDTSPPEKWLEDFRRDRNPEREVVVYEEIARAYVAYVSTRPLALDQKREVYGLLLARSGSDDVDEVLRRATLESLTVDEARDVLGHYRLPAAPITVTTPSEP